MVKTMRKKKSTVSLDHFLVFSHLSLEILLTRPKKVQKNDRPTDENGRCLYYVYYSFHLFIFHRFFNVISPGVIMCLLTTDDDENNNKTCYLGHYWNNFVNEFNLTEEKINL